MQLFKNWFQRNKQNRNSLSRRPRGTRQLAVESLETRDLMSANPVLMVIANQDFYYQEYGDTRQSLEAAGLDVVVAATTTATSTPHANSGQGSSSGQVTPDLALADVNADDYSAIVFVGGWGSSMYQYAYNDPNLDGRTDNFYANSLYNGDNDLNDGRIAETKVVVNNLINDFIAEDKYVAAICHGVTVLAWARVDGASPLDGKEVAVPLTVGAPAQYYDGVWYNNMYLAGQYEQVIANGASANDVSGQHGDASTVADGVVVDGRIITAENYDSALYFGQVIAREVLAGSAASNAAPQVADATWTIAENTAAGSVVGAVAATDADAGQTLTYAIVAGNTDGAFAIDAATGLITVANASALDFETTPVFSLTVRAVDDAAVPLAGHGEITVNLTDLVESPVTPSGSDVIVNGTAGHDTIYLGSGAAAHRVFGWLSGTTGGSERLPEGGRVSGPGG
ncbi:MAG: DJ-1/PfpI family protein, partial [Gemmataceae bacterium]